MANRDISGEVINSIVVEDGLTQTKLHDSAVRALSSIAIRNQLTVPVALQQAIHNEAFLLRLEADGYNLVIAQPGGQMHYLERSS